MADITGERIRYTIKAVVEYDALQVVNIQLLLDEINLYGEAEVVKVETIKEKK